MKQHEVSVELVGVRWEYRTVGDRSAVYVATKMAAENPGVEVFIIHMNDSMGWNAMTLKQVDGKVVRTDEKYLFWSKDVEPEVLV